MVGSVDDIDDRGGVCIVAAPVRTGQLGDLPYTRLPAEIPYLHRQIAVFDRLDIESDRCVSEATYSVSSKLLRQAEVGTGS